MLEVLFFSEMILLQAQQLSFSAPSVYNLAQ